MADRNNPSSSSKDDNRGKKRKQNSKPSSRASSSDGDNSFYGISGVDDEDREKTKGAVPLELTEKMLKGRIKQLIGIPGVVALENCGATRQDLHPSVQRTCKYILDYTVGSGTPAEQTLAPKWSPVFQEGSRLDRIPDVILRVLLHHC